MASAPRGWLPPVMSGTHRAIRAQAKSVIRSALVLALALCAAPLAAQPAPGSSGDAELDSLIPPEAVASPTDWARTPPPEVPETAPIITPAAAAELNPATPLLAIPGLDLAWPVTDVPPLAALPALADGSPAAAPMPELSSTLLAPRPNASNRRRDPLAGGRVQLVWPADAIPERAAIEARFHDLATLTAQPPRANETTAQLGVRGASDAALLKQVLRVYGYYDGEVTQALVAQGTALPAGTPPATRIRFIINPGKRYTYGQVTLPGLEATGSDAPQLARAFAIKAGDPINSDTILAQAANFDVAFDEAGYAFVHVGAPALTIDHAKELGDLTLPVTPGGKYLFGHITSSAPRLLSAKHLARIARFKPGQPYRESAVTDLRQAILATGLVSQLVVAPREVTPPAGPAPAQPGVADVVVTMTAAPPRTISGAIGYDTAEGFRLEVDWEHRNLFPPEGALRLRGVAGTNEQLAGATFRRNNFGGRDKALTVDLYAQNANLTAFSARKVAFAATYERQTTLLFQKPWSWSFGAVAEASEEREGAPTGSAAISCGVTLACLPPRALYVTGAVPLRAAYDGSDSLLNPRHGWRGSLRVSPEIAFTAGRTSAYVNLEGNASAYLPLTDSITLAGRVRIGSIIGTSLAGIAPSRRFYAGGGGSIRGFGYDLVGPRNSFGEPTGGRSVYELSGEARVRTPWFGGALSLAPFVDAGGAEVTARPDFGGLRFGAGVGLRYDSAVGPIRVDVGTPLNPHPGDSRVGVYVSLGQSF